MVTRDEFGDAAPAIAAIAASDAAGEHRGPADFAAYLTWLDGRRALRTGDVVMLGDALLSPAQWMRLEGDDLVERAPLLRVASR
jgi:hypothetical protein